VANIKSQIKRNKTNEIRHERNKAVRSELKTRLKNAVAAAQDGSAEDTVAAGRLAQKRLDKAAAKKVIHKNAAARRNSRLAKRLNAAASASSEG
jgi:small subunit ribosomal protein S20